MVYARKNRMRKTLRNNRTLSTRRIFNNKGAKAQAKQIWALRKRINRVYNRTKPEYKLLRVESQNRSFGAQLLNGPAFLQNHFISSVNVPQPGTGDNQRIGNKLNLFPMNFFMNVRYTENNEIINNVYPYIQQPLNSNGMMLRFVAIQAIAADSVAPTMNDIFQDNLTSEGALSPDLMMMMTMPFKNGITARYKILKDKRISANHDKPLYAARFKVKPQIKTLRWEDGKNYPAGMIFYLIIGAGGDIRSAVNEDVRYYNYNYLDTTWRYEMTYTDA